MIDIKGLYDIYQLHSPQNMNRPTKRAAEELTAGAAGDSVGMDVIQISPEASFRSRLETVSKAYMQKPGAELSSQRLDALRSKYQGDSCPVDGADTARALLNRINVPVAFDRLHAAYPENRVSGDL